MKIVAYSRIPASTPFVHLGYLAASTTTTKPAPGLLFGGILVLFAGLSVMSGRLFRQRRSAQSNETQGLRSYWLRRIGLALVLLGGAFLWSAFAFGEKDRVYAHPEEATSGRIWEFGLSVADRAKPGISAGSATRLPTEGGEYELFSALNLPERHRERCMDGWNTPLILRVSQHEGQLTYLVVSAGPDRTLGTQDDITSDDRQ